MYTRVKSIKLEANIFNYKGQGFGLNFLDEGVPIVT